MNFALQEVELERTVLWQREMPLLREQQTFISFQDGSHDYHSRLLPTIILPSPPAAP